MRAPRPRRRGGWFGQSDELTKAWHVRALGLWLLVHNGVRLVGQIGALAGGLGGRSVTWFDAPAGTAPVFGVLAAFESAVIVIGMVSLFRVRDYAFVMVSVVLAVLPVAPPALPIVLSGIVLLVILSQPRARREFATTSEPVKAMTVDELLETSSRPPRRIPVPLIAAGVALIALIVVAFLGRA